MKNWVLIFVFSSWITSLFAQSEEELGKITLSVVMPENVKGLDISQLSRLQTKITQIVTGSGLAASGFDQNFVIYPTFTINESSVVESGLQDITVLNCEIALIIKDYENNVIFSSVTKSLKGSGKSKSQAMTSALSKIDVSDPVFKSFITTGKIRIIDYFNTKCDIIIQNAFALVKLERFDEAIYNLTSVPEVCDECFFRCLDTLESIYALKINADCRNNLQEAKITWASSQTSEGAEKVVSLISAINPLADCQKDVEKLIKEINEKLRSDQKANWQFKMKQYQDSVAAQRARWDFEMKKYFNDSDRYKNGSTVEINVNTGNTEHEKVKSSEIQQSPDDNKNTSNQKVSSQTSTSNSGVWSETVSNKLSYKERKARRNQNLDRMRVREYRNVGMAYAQSKPKRMKYNSVSRK